MFTQSAIDSFRDALKEQIPALKVPGQKKYADLNLKNKCIVNCVVKKDMLQVGFLSCGYLPPDTVLDFISKNELDATPIKDDLLGSIARGKKNPDYVTFSVTIPVNNDEELLQSDLIVNVVGIMNSLVDLFAPLYNAGTVCNEKPEEDTAMNSSKNKSNSAMEWGSYKRVILTYNRATEYVKEEVVYKKGNEEFDGHVIWENQKAMIRLTFDIASQSPVVFYYMMRYQDLEKFCEFGRDDSAGGDKRLWAPEAFEVLSSEGWGAKWYRKGECSPISESEFDDYVGGDQEVDDYSIDAHDLISVELESVNGDVVDYDFKKDDSLISFLKEKILQDATEDFKDFLASSANEDIMEAISTLYRKSPDSSSEEDDALSDNTAICCIVDSFFYFEKSDAQNQRTDILAKFKDLISAFLALDCVDDSLFSFSLRREAPSVCGSVDDVEKQVLMKFDEGLNDYEDDEEVEFALAVELGFVLAKGNPFDVLNEFCLKNSETFNLRVIVEMPDHKFSYQGYCGGELDSGYLCGGSACIFGDDDDDALDLFKHKKLLLG